MGSMSLETNLNYNDENDTQTLPPGAERINAEAYAKMKNNGFKSDFYMMMARPEDASVANEIAKHMLKEGRDVCFECVIMIMTLFTYSLLKRGSLRDVSQLHLIVLHVHL